MKNNAFDFMNSSAVVLFDWGIAVAAILYGLWSIYNGDTGLLPYLSVIFGIFGCFLAHYRPVNILKNRLRKQLIKR